MKNQLYSVGVDNENPTCVDHTFSVSLEFHEPIRKSDARNWLQRVIADAAHEEFEIDD